MFGRFETNTCFRGFSGSDVYFLCFKMSTVYLMCFSRTRRSGVHLSCMSLSESEEKRWLLKQHILPSTCLLPAEHVISHHNSGLLLQIQQSAWPGPWEHSDRYQTRDGWHTTRTLTVSPFSLFYVGMDTIQNAKPVMHATGGRGLYQWMGHAFVCLLGSLTITPLSLNTKKNLVWLLLQPTLPPAKLLFICTASPQLWGN